ARAFVELDGVAARVILCPPGVRDEHIAHLAGHAAFDAAVVDRERPAVRGEGVKVAQVTGPGTEAWATNGEAPRPAALTEWAMFTSGTTGAPKLAVHTLAGLTGAIAPSDPRADPPVWATFYDIRRYGGL